MQYRQLGRTDMKVSAVSFGAWAIGGAWGPVDDEDSMKALHAAIDAGTNFIDTADVYGDGHSERLVARFGGLATDGRPSFPGGAPLMLLPILAALMQLPAARFYDAEARRESDLQQAQVRREMEVRGDSVRRAQGRDTLSMETKAPPQP